MSAAVKSFVGGMARFANPAFYKSEYANLSQSNGRPPFFFPWAEWDMMQGTLCVAELPVVPAQPELVGEGRGLVSVYALARQRDPS